MIAWICGQLLAKNPPKVVVECHGIGYELDVPMSTFYALPDLHESIQLLVHFLVREDAHLLFGFLTEEERVLFRQLMKVSGIGARIALAVLSGLSVAQFQQAVRAQDHSVLTTIPGIGRKTAHRMVLELRDQMPLEESAGSTTDATMRCRDVYSALLALGYSEKEIGRVLKQLPEHGQVVEHIRLALSLLSK